MNILKPLPDSFFIDGQEYKINTGFKAWLNFALYLQKGKIDREFINVLKPLFLCDIQQTKNIDKLILACFEFFKNAKSYSNQFSSDNKQADDVILFDYELDSNYIYGAFKQQYGIDLIDEDLHYYKFIALIDCLSEETLFKKIINIRQTDTKKIKDKDYKKSMEQLKKIYMIDENSKLSHQEIEEKKRLDEQKKQDFINEWGL